MKELVMLCALPAAGKSTLVKEYTDRGFEKLSKDDVGSLKFDEKIETKMKLDREKIILDNTYVTKDSRKKAIELAKQYGYKVTCLHLKTSLEDAQINAVKRMIQRHGKLFMKDADYSHAKDPNMFPMAAMYKARKQFEAPTTVEGFDEVKAIPFKRSLDGYTNKALIVDYDQTLRETKSGDGYPIHPDDITILPGRAEKLKEYRDKGYILLGVSNQSGVAKGVFTYEQAEACFKKTNELLGIDIDFRFCPHKVPPITCYCRKPGVGFGVEFIEKYKLNAAETIMVGDMGSDESFAKRCGFKFIHADKFFK